MNITERKKLMGGSEDLNKPTPKAIARFESMLSREEKNQIFKELKYDLNEHQVESQIRATVRRNPAFVEKILKKPQKQDDGEEKKKEEIGLTIEYVLSQGEEFVMKLIREVLKEMEVRGILQMLLDIGKLRIKNNGRCSCWSQNTLPNPCPHSAFM